MVTDNVSKIDKSLLTTRFLTWLYQKKRQSTECTPGAQAYENIVYLFCDNLKTIKSVIMKDLNGSIYQSMYFVCVSAHARVHTVREYINVMDLP